MPMFPASIHFLLPLFALAAAAVAVASPVSSQAPITSVSDSRRASIVAFCRKNSGRKVGDGECWALANEAFKATGARRPQGQLRVWGRQLDLRRESPLPGDILECDGTRFSDGSYVSKQHTAVIIAVHSPGFVRIAEQNFAGKKKVRERNLEISGLRSGKIFIYRPQ
jgi:hypothetical protein